MLFLYACNENDFEVGYKSMDIMKLYEKTKEFHDGTAWSISPDPPNYEDDWFLSLDSDEKVRG